MEVKREQVTCIIAVADHSPVTDSTGIQDALVRQIDAVCI